MGNRLFEDTTFVNAEKLSYSKLNALNTRIRSGLEMLARCLSKTSGDDRVIDDQDSTTECKVIASSPADMNVNVQIGLAMVSGTLVEIPAIEIKALVAPTTSFRYSIIQISNEGAVTVVDGSEGGAEPSAESDNIKLAAIYLPQATTKIENTDGGYGYIIDRRDIMSYHPATIERLWPFSIFGNVSTSGGPNSDGYYYGTSTAGIAFGEAITITKVTINSLEPPSGEDLVLTFHNVTDATSDTATLTDGETFEPDTSIDLDLDAADELAVQVTTDGGTLPDSAGWIHVTVHYELQ